MRWFVSITLALSLLLQACFLGRLPLGIETSFTDGSSKSWRFLRGPDASGTLEGAGGARGVLAVLKDASSWKAVASDTLGNVLALAGTGGDFTRRTFDPWGNQLTRDTAGNLRASTLSERRADYDALPLAWASQEVDPDTGLSHYHFREYSPSLGGWLTQDPIGLAGGYLNLRSYLGNRPADALDKEGRFAWVAPGAAIGGIIGGAFGAVVGAVDEYQTNPNASAWDLFKAGGKGLLVGGGAGIVVGSGVGLVAEVAVAGAGAAQAGLGAGGALTMAAHKANEVGIPQLIEAVGNPVPTAPVGAMVRTELGMAKAAGAGAKGVGQLGAKISVAENATTRAAAKSPCPEVITTSAEGADDVLNAVRLRNQLVSREIAGGHAFEKHAAEFGFKSQSEMAAHIENVMAKPTAVRNLSRGRTAYWDDATQSIVIRNPSAADGGTAFKPIEGRAYFETLK